MIKSSSRIYCCHGSGQDTISCLRPPGPSSPSSAAERGRDHLNVFKDFHLKNGSKPQADNLSEIVSQNQKIMLNRELDEPVVDLLRLNLERDLTRRAACTDESEVHPLFLSFSLA